MSEVLEAPAETAAQKNRRLFPGFVDFVDAMRGVFGDVKVRHIYNNDTGDEVGKRDEREWVQVSGTFVNPNDVVQEKPKAPTTKAGKRRAMTRYKE